MAKFELCTIIQERKQNKQTLQTTSFSPVRWKQKKEQRTKNKKNKRMSEFSVKVMDEFSMKVTNEFSKKSLASVSLGDLSFLSADLSNLCFDSIAQNCKRQKIPFGLVRNRLRDEGGHVFFFQKQWR